DNYYTGSAPLYRRFHSPEGGMHLPIENSSNETHQQKLLFQANCVGTIIKKFKYQKVLELGCGTGFNI
ncbi:hypothetical protein GWO25_02505, partial [Candidatus Saccharibacteria bacterium]|nr:hypothetical protein [Candidatus Saccharibacteria bacterium]